MSGWFQNYRYEWIREMIDIYGFINRDHLRRKFGISMPQAAEDLKQVQLRWPDLVTYNLSSKRYERT